MRIPLIVASIQQIVSQYGPYKTSLLQECDQADAALPMDMDQERSILHS
ncbi:MAG: hypothetical protein AAF768_07085 [Pseudomonadota bacterium]